MWNVIANMKNNLLFLVSNRLQSTIWCFEEMQRISSRIFHEDHTRSPVMMIRWSKRWWHIYDLFSSPNPLLIIPTAKTILKRLLLRDFCVWRFFCFWLSHFLAWFAISNYLSVWIWFLQQFIHTWNVKWVDYKMNWKLASISSIALRISWLCFVSANFLSVGSSTTDLGPTPGSLGW